MVDSDIVLSVWNLVKCWELVSGTESINKVYYRLATNNIVQITDKEQLPFYEDSGQI